MANDVDKCETCLALNTVGKLINFKGLKLKGFSIGNV